MIEELTKKEAYWLNIFLNKEGYLPEQISLYLLQKGKHTIINIPWFLFFFLYLEGP